MYQKVSDKVAMIGMGIMTAGMDEAQALKILQQAKSEDIQKALRQHAMELKSGKEAFEAIKTAAIDLKSILLALALLAPAAMATPEGTMKLIPLSQESNITMNVIDQVEKGEETKAVKSVKDEAKAIKDTIVTMEPGKPIVSAPITIGGKKYVAENSGQAGILKQIVKLDNKMKGLETAKAIPSGEHQRVISDLLSSARIPTR